MRTVENPPPSFPKEKPLSERLQRLAGVAPPLLDTPASPTRPMEYEDDPEKPVRGLVGEFSFENQTIMALTDPEPAPRHGRRGSSSPCHTPIPAKPMVYAMDPPPGRNRVIDHSYKSFRSLI